MGVVQRFRMSLLEIANVVVVGFFPTVILKNLGSFQIQKQERVTNMTFFFGGGV